MRLLSERRHPRRQRRCVDRTPKPTDEQIGQALSGVLCRCFGASADGRGDQALRAERAHDERAAIHAQRSRAAIS